MKGKRIDPDGDYGLVKCGDCDCTLPRYKAGLHLTKLYLCSKCEYEEEYRNDELRERLDILDIETAFHDLDCDCVLCDEQRDIENKLKSEEPK
jgi:hypothetical protein